MEKAAVYAKQKSVGISPKKVAIVLDLVRGLAVKDAERILMFDDTKAAKITLKVLKSAFANAKNNLKLNEEDLYVSEIRVDGGRAFKRGRIVARSRTSPILKRTSHITVGLSEKNSGAGGKR